MMDIKKLAAGVIAGAAIAAGPVIAFAAPASAATDAGQFAGASHAQVVEQSDSAPVLVNSARQLGTAQGSSILGDVQSSRMLGDSANQLGSVQNQLGAGHSTPCGGGINCR